MLNLVPFARSGRIVANGYVQSKLISDLLEVITGWGPCPDCNDCPADLNNDCSVGISDLLILFANWG